MSQIERAQKEDNRKGESARSPIFGNLHRRHIPKAAADRRTLLRAGLRAMPGASFAVHMAAANNRSDRKTRRRLNEIFAAAR
jgi:hypothetical protein